LAVDVNPLIELSMTDRRLPASSRSITADVVTIRRVVSSSSSSSSSDE